MKNKMIYVLGFILMFSSSGVYLIAQGMGGGGFGPDREFSDEDSDMRMQQREGMGEGMGMRQNEGMEMGLNIQDMEKMVIGIIEKHDSEFAKEIQKIRQTDKKKYFLILRSSTKPLMACKNHGGDDSMEKDVVKGIKLRYETRELSFKYKKASSSEQETIKKSLETKVSELFDLRAKGQEIRIKNMEKEMANLHAKLKDRKAHKADIVKIRVDQLTGKKYSW